MKQGSIGRALCALIVAGTMFVGAAYAQAPNYTLIAGRGFDDGGQATAANMHGARDVVFDAAGNAYVSQSTANRIRKITPAGVITTIAGSGVIGFSGDNGPASAATINRPEGLALDAAGNLYFSDAGNHRVRRIGTNGVITTVAGNGGAVHAGDGGLAVDAGIKWPSGLAVDGAGNLYIADFNSRRVRKVTPGGTISTFAGTGVWGYSGDNGPATSAMIRQPAGLAVDAAGNLYIADYSSSHAIRKVATDGTITTAFVVNDPANVAVDSTGAVYAGDGAYCLLVKWTTGAPVTIAGNAALGCADGAAGGAATTTAIGSVDGIGFDAAGNVVFVDTDFARVRKVTTGSGLISHFAGVGGRFADGTAAVGAPLSPGMSIAVEADGDVVLADSLANSFVSGRISRITPAGTISTIAGTGTVLDSGACASSGLPCPATQLYLRGYGLTLDADGTVYVSDYLSRRVIDIGSDGTASLFAGASDRDPTTGNGDNGPATEATMTPLDIARDSAGNVFIADEQGNRIRRVDPSGTITTYAGTGFGGSSGDGGPATSANILAPSAVATDSVGNVYMGEGLRVRKVTPAGLITTIAGNGTLNVLGDGGPAIDAAVGLVDGIAVDQEGVVYLAANGGLRRILTNGRIESLTGWTHHATALAIRNGQLYISTREGLVYRTDLPATPGIAHDYDGDGHSDIAWRNPQSGANVVWKSANSATTQTVMGVSNPAWKIVGQGDFDADGKSDLVWRNDQNGVNAIWRSADYTSQISVVGVTNLAWSIEGVGDFDGDGEADLFWRNPTSGQNVVWHSANAADQTVLTPVGGNAWQVVGVGDFDGDGNSDLLWRNVSTGMNSIWRSGNAATPQAMTGVTNLAWKIQGVGDFDGDGKSDVFFRNTSTGQNVIWNSGNSATQRVLVGVTSQLWRVVSTGDYDGDGKADLLWRNTGNGSDVIWRSGDPTLQMPVTGVTNTAWTIVPYENQP